MYLSLPQTPIGDSPLIRGPDITVYWQAKRPEDPAVRFSIDLFRYFFISSRAFLTAATSSLPVLVMAA